MLNTNAVTLAIGKFVEAHKLTGVSVCVRNTDGVMYEHCWGERDLNRSIPVDRDTMFGIASLSKSITSLCLCILAAEGKLNLDDPVYRYVPEFRVPGAARDAVTIRHLAMHTAGIPPMEPLEWSIAMNSERRESKWLLDMRRNSPNSMSTIQQVMDYIANCPYPTVGAPGENLSYSNEGYAVLSYVVDAAAGMKLEEYCDEKIFKPLGMNRTIMDDDCRQAREISGGNITSLFEEVDGKILSDDNWSILPPFRGCAMVKSTAPDLSAYYQCLANRGIHNGRQVIPAKAVEELIGERYPVTEYDYYCMGLNKYTRYGHVFCEHSGGLHGVSTRGALLKDEGIGIAILCNMGDAATEGILWILYSALLGMNLDTCFRRYAPVGRDFSDPEMLIGAYIGHEGETEILEIINENGRLYGVNEDRRFILKYCGATRFLGYRREEDTTPAERLEFLIRNGQAWGVRIGTRIYTRK